MGVDWKVYNISKDIETLMSLLDEMKMCLPKNLKN